MTRFFVIVAALCLIQVALAADIQGDGTTILKPTTSGDGTSGTTIMSPSGQVSENSACATGACSSSSSNFVAAKVVGASCGCSEAVDDCGCRKKAQYVEPELKSEHSENSCGCQDEPVCGCRDNTVSFVHRTTDACGCVHEQVCACRKTQYVQPELKSDCPCAAQVQDDCACSHFRRN